MPFEHPQSSKIACTGSSSSFEPMKSIVFAHLNHPKKAQHVKIVNPKAIQ